MYGGNAAVMDGLRLSSATPAQTKVYERVVEAVGERLPPPNLISKEEAVRELLHGSSVYEATGAKVVPFRRGKVSLPTSVLDAPCVLDLVSPAVRDQLERFDECLLLPPDARREVAATSSVRSYMDPILRGNAPVYRRFVSELKDKGLLLWTRSPKMITTPFFVGKKDGSLRMILDARKTNEVFKPPPATRLCTGETLSKLEIGLDMDGDLVVPQLWFASGDVSDCFHRFRTWLALAEWFSLPAVPAGCVGVDEVNGEAVGKHELIFPCWGSLPMGFSLSLWLVQECNSRLVREGCPHLGRGLIDAGPTPVFDAVGMSLHYVYVDNVGVIADSAAAARQKRDEACDYLDSVGLKTHERDEPSRVSDNIGIALDGQRCEARPTTKRYWKVRRCLQWA
jgi:hypothetical protein